MNRKIVYIIIVIAVAACAAKTAFSYEAKGKRDPFVPLIGQDKRGCAATLEGVSSVQDVVLEGIATGSGGKNVAILNGQMIKENDKFGVLRIKKISKKTVEISIEGKDYTLNLQKEEGIKVGK